MDVFGVLHRQFLFVHPVFSAGLCQHANLSYQSPLAPSNGSQILSYPLLGKECSFFQWSQFEVCDHQQQWWYSTALEHWEQSLWTNLHGSLSEILGTYIRELWNHPASHKHFFSPNGGLVMKISLFQGNLGWWNIIIWPDSLLTNNLQWFWVDVSILFC